jgi:hypothetical protein
MHSLKQIEDASTRHSRGENSMTPLLIGIEDIGAKEVSVEPSPLQKSLSAAKTSHPALMRLRRKIASQDEDSGVMTDYSRMHHRHNRE